MAKHLFFGMMVAATALSGLPVLAQTAPAAGTSGSPTNMTTSVPPVATGMPASPSATMSTSSTSKYVTADNQVRVSKIVGASVYNDQNQSIGSVDDILMGDRAGKVGTAVLSVGGFLGMGSKLVSVPFDQLKIEDNKIVMPGATKASLEGMPEYKFG
jgi:sporulation protein YlmC with PRC-barrel domain